MEASADGRNVMNQADAAIFDMDGVLVDTYQARYSKLAGNGPRRGSGFQRGRFCANLRPDQPRGHRNALGGKVSQRGARLPPMEAQKEAAFRHVVQEEVPLMPGTSRCCNPSPREGFRLAVGSSAPPENVNLVLDWMNLRDLFHAVVSGADVTRGKPDPQVFQLAAQGLGVPPGGCVVIEDAPAGLAAAAAAGMASVGLVSTGRTRDALADADLLVASLSELSRRCCGE